MNNEYNNSPRILMYHPCSTHQRPIHRPNHSELTRDVGKSRENQRAGGPSNNNKINAKGTWYRSRIGMIRADAGVGSAGTFGRRVVSGDARSMIERLSFCSSDSLGRARRTNCGARQFPVARFSNPGGSRTRKPSLEPPPPPLLLVVVVG